MHGSNVKTFRDCCEFHNQIFDKCSIFIHCEMKSVKNHDFRSLYLDTHLYRGADKSLAGPGRKKANFSVRMA